MSFLGLGPTFRFPSPADQERPPESRPSAKTAQGQHPLSPSGGGPPAHDQDQQAHDSLPLSLLHKTSRGAPPPPPSGYCVLAGAPKAEPKEGPCGEEAPDTKAMATGPASEEAEIREKFLGEIVKGGAFARILFAKGMPKGTGKLGR